MDSIKKFTEGENNSDTSQQQSSDQTNSAAGGGRETKNGVGLVEKGIDLVEEKLLGQDTHDNEFAAEQAKDAQISEFVEDQLKSATGKGTPI